MGILHDILCKYKLNIPSHINQLMIQLQVGYTGGSVENPTYLQVCSESTGHCEVVRVIYDPNICTYEMLLKTFWENHDPTQLDRQVSVEVKSNKREINIQIDQNDTK